MAQPIHSSMTDPHSWLLQVTIGQNYDSSTHEVVTVNRDEPYHVSTDDLEADVYVRIRDFRGLPEDSPKSSSYFSHPNHKNDRYSISLSFRPKWPINGSDLVWGNDFDHPVRDMLPPGFSYAFKFVKWWLDPGLEGNPYADEPWLYGPILSSMNAIWVGDKVGESREKDQTETQDQHHANGHGSPSVRNSADGAENQQNSANSLDADLNIEETFDGFVPIEGASQSGRSIREDHSIPSDPSARRKHFLDPERRSSFVFEPDREYRCDFHNEFLDFSDFSLKLPGFSLNVIRHLGRHLKRDHTLRYVLKDKGRNKELLVVLFTLIPADGSEFAEWVDDVESTSVKGSDEDKDDKDEDKDEDSDLVDDDIPQKYAIFSHTWIRDEEVTSEDFTKGMGKHKDGYKKIEFCGEQTVRDGLEYFWVDTCCIDKSNNTELSKAINSIFRWYRNATRCYVYLSDVLGPVSGANNSEWEMEAEMHEALRKVRQDQENHNPLDKATNPFNKIFLAYETMWRVVLHGFLEVKFRNAPDQPIWLQSLESICQQGMTPSRKWQKLGL
ncbi:DUF1769-domain-containing protein [Eremomyces bilateralis CBS 781.70]|uniref:DUF1769-domain-containing protein n=1 Tax=Eremomyces bilateralis CBS 781.70 TaxID=1392243 RepID=A0A6G1G8N6_9PEZI|nr:DUF1769-domain-containing protein [Eremomyces bilateralis CBS 781.70]KAF1814393.1 DUF1769-domain-containing protein [Eremomyces bilateralis CBS 781.70]